MTTRMTQFFHDAVGNRTKVTDPDSRTTYYTYDKVNRLTGIPVNPITGKESLVTNPVNTS
jgi:YD repeat-containing protein